MTDSKPTRDDLIKQLKTPGWNLQAGASKQSGTLEEIARASHARHAKGEEPGLVKRLENEAELELIDLQQLWAHLGLPM